MKLQNLLIISTALLSGTQVLSRSVVELMAAEGIEIVDNGLNLANKGLTSLEGLTGIDGIEGVQWLFLDHNQLSTLPAGVFNGLTSLRFLYLNHNQLSTLPAGIFDGLTSLQWLYLNDNQLSTLPPGIFDGLTSLRFLYLHHNQLSALPAGIFDGLTSLQWLYLNDNQLSTLPPGIFDGLTSLQWLYLNDNQLSTLPAGIFDGLTSLQWLYLNDNQLSTLPAGVFNGLTSLQELYLYNNRLSGPQVARIEQFARQRNINLTIHSQDAPPLELVPNVTKEEYEEVVGITAYEAEGHTQKEVEEFKEKKYEEEGCLICKGAVPGHPDYLTACNHRFHVSCLSSWLNRPNVNTIECPLCKQNMFAEVAALGIQKKNLHLAKNTTKKSRKKEHLHVAHNAKKTRAVRA